MVAYAARVDDTTRPMLRVALEHLAADPDAQADYLQQLGTWPSLDELALELDDVAGASEAWGTPELVGRVRALSSKLEQMSGQENAQLWQPEALQMTEWTHIRALARQALAALDE
jgi:hypothetical protein